MPYSKLPNPRPKQYSIEQLNAKKPLESKWTALYYTDKKGKNSSKYIMCRCICGREKEIVVCNLVSGHSLSCSCSARIKRRGKGIKYNGVNNFIRSCYFSMMERCYKPRSRSFKDYGAKGVIVCDEWKNNYQAFLDWALSNGWAKGLELDKDIKGNGLLYSPENCCFVTHQKNMGHTSRTVYVIYNSVKMSLSEACRKGGFKYSLINRRINNGYTFDEAITNKLKDRSRLLEYDNKIMTPLQWSKLLGIRQNVIYDRLRKGWSIDKVLSKHLFANTGNPRKLKKKYREIGTYRPIL